LIGEQATGKSTVAKVLAVCRYYSYIRPEARVVKGLSNFSEGLIAWGLREFVKKDSNIFYECDHYSLSVDQEIPTFATIQPNENEKSEEQRDLRIFQPTLRPKSEEFKNLLAAEKEIYSRPRNGHAAILPPSFFQNNVANVMDNPFYLPTERGLQSIFSLGKSSIGNLSDSLFNQFAQLDQIARLFNNDTNIDPLEIVYKNVDGKGYIRKSREDSFYSLFSAASGYQSTIPAVLAIKYYSEIRAKRKTFLIEEPELNLYPDAQNRLMQFLADNSNRGNSILSTTHSPYILTSLNNMMYAYQIGQKRKIEANNILAGKYWMNPNEVSAYMMLSDGGYEDIFDRQEGLIKAEKIDKISGVLNEQFTNLLNTEFERK